MLHTPKEEGKGCTTRREKVNGSNTPKIPSRGQGIRKHETSFDFRKGLKRDFGFQGSSVTPEVSAPVACFFEFLWQPLIDRQNQVFIFFRKPTLWANQVFKIN